MTKRLLAAALALVAIAGVVAAGPAGAHPRVPGRPNGITLQQAQRATDVPFGDCAVAGVVCKPALDGSCQNYTSQTTAPADIRVFDATYSGANHIRTVPFKTYVEDVLPNEWTDTWDGDALKAGAVAITSYAWYWVTHFGGYVGTNSASTCFDVTDDQNFQVFKNGSAASYPNSVSKVEQVFPNAIRRGGAVLQASYFSAVRSDYDVRNSKTYDACGQSADGTFLSQSGSQTCNEDNTANKWPVILKTYYGSNIQIASTAQLRTQHDFRYLHASTEATFNAGRWALNDIYGTVIPFGQKGDIPVVNTAGDGFARVGVYRPSNHGFYFGSPVGKVATYFSFGNTGDVPVAAQYNGLTSPTQAAVFRPSNGNWYFATTSGKVASAVQYGARGDIPVPGRWTSASTDSIAVYRPSTGTWYRRGASTVQFGAKGDIPVPGDYNGDGLTEIAVFRPSTGDFYVYGQAKVHFGAKGDIPVTGDFTGDGRADLAVYRPSTHTWYVRGGSTTSFGATGSTPIGKAPYAD